MTVTVILVHSNVLLSEGLRRLLEDTPYKVSLHATSFETIKLEASRLQGGLLVLVGCSTEAKLIETVQNIRDKLSAAYILAMGATSQPRQVMLALEAGADGYLREEITSRTLITAIELLVESETVLPSAFVKTLARLGRAMGNVMRSSEFDTDLADLDGKNGGMSESESVNFEPIVTTEEASGHGRMRAAPPEKITEEVQVRGIMRRKHVKNRAQAAIYAFRGSIRIVALKPRP